MNDILKVMFSLDGERPVTGHQILIAYNGDEDVRRVLESVASTKSYVLSRQIDIRPVEVLYISDEDRTKEIESAIFSVGGGVPTRGKTILRDNDYEAYTYLLLLKALDTGSSSSFNTERIELIAIP